MTEVKKNSFTEKRFFKLKTIDNRERVAGIIRNYLSGKCDVIFAYLHGSFLKKGGFRDIDVAIFTKGLLNEIEIESDFSYGLTEKTGFPVEIKVINKAPVAFQMAILKEGKALLVRSDVVLSDFIENVSKRYIEYIHFRNIFLDI